MEAHNQDGDMAEPRAPKSEELNKVIDFLNKNLRQDHKWSIANEYPLAFSGKNLNNIRIVEKNGEIVSHAVLKTVLVKTPIAIFKVAAIGSVVTAPEHRNQGYSRAVINDCLRAATEQDCDFAILWTDQYDFYQKLGFELAGSEVALIVHSPLDVHTENITFLRSNQVDPNAILKLYSQHNVGTLRVANDIFHYLQIPNCELYTAWDTSNRLLAYAVEGRGADLTNYVHEWGGSVSKLIPLFNEIRKYKNKPLTIISPQHSSNLIRRMKEHGVLVNEGYLGMIKILNTKNLFFKVRRFARYLGEEDFVIEHNGHDYIVGHSGHLFHSNSEKDIVRLIFGPHKSRELQSFDMETRTLFEKVFPIPMWVWGWDSV